MRLDEMISVDNANANANDDGCRLSVVVSVV